MFYQIVNPVAPAMSAFLDIFNNLPDSFRWLCFAALFLLFVVSLVRSVMG